MTNPVPLRIFEILQSEYDLDSSRDEFLHFETPFEILIATILSAQTTDKCVNQVTKVLFSRFPDPSSLAAADPGEVEDIVHSTGFYRAKSRNIIAASKMLMTDYGGVVPDRMEQLITIPGVGRKTANIVIHHAFGRADGIAVDTHVRRVSMRLGLSDHSDPDRIEQDLLGFFPRDIWGDINGLFILHGRRVCTARSPGCHQCVLFLLCRYAHVSVHGKE